jgi:hypothetical protein
MSEVILKGEIHTSKGDLDEEREIVKNGVDVLILEQDDPEMESQYGWFDGWFQWSAILFFWFLETVYRSKIVLEDLADFQDADIQYTRETNAEMLDNASILAKGLGASLFYIILLVGVGLGAASGPAISMLDIYGAVLLFLAVGLPPLVIRIHNMRSATGNRDQIIAEKIAAAAEDDARVVAVVGGAHLPGIREALPDDLNLTVHRPVYGMCTARHVREVVPPLFKTGLGLFSFYLLAVWGFSYMLELYQLLGV